MRLAVTFLALVLLSSGAITAKHTVGAAPVVARQDTTPPALADDIASCQAATEPRPIEFFTPLLVAPTPTPAATEPEKSAEAVTPTGTEYVPADHADDAVSSAPDDSFSVPPGWDADPTTVAAVEAALRAMVACINAGDFLRFAALFTDDYWVAAFRSGAWAGFWGIEAAATDPAAFETFVRETESVAPDQHHVLRNLEEVVVLLDGRVGAVAFLATGYEPYTPPAGGESIRGDWYVFASVGGRFLIDEFPSVVIFPVYGREPTPTGPAPTPAGG